MEHKRCGVSPEVEILLSSPEVQIISPVALGVTPAKRRRQNPSETIVISSSPDSIVVSPTSPSSSAAQSYEPKKGEFSKKWARASPYNIFYTAVQPASQTWNQETSVTLSELLDKSLGDIKLSLHLTYCADINWLKAQYLLADQKANFTIFCDQHGDINADLDTMNIVCHRVERESLYGRHHSKISMLLYRDRGIRIIVSTANLHKSDWEIRTQRCVSLAVLIFI